MYSLHRIARFIRRPVVAASRRGAVISVDPKSRLVDDKVKIIVSGLEPEQHVTLEAKLVDEKGYLFKSHAHYISDNDGEVDVGRDLSLGGYYRGVEPMGLLWSMKPGQRKELRLTKKDVTKPFEVELKCFDNHISPNEGSKQLLSSSTFEQWYMAVGVKRVVLKGLPFQGTLFIPPGDGPFPGLIELKGGTTGVHESKASLFASRGFLTLNLTYLPPVEAGIPEYIELDPFAEILDWFCKYPNVVPGGIGLHAICFGSWIALLLASFRSDVVNAVVAISPVSSAHHIPFKYQGKMSEKHPIDRSKLIHKKDGVVARDALSTETEDNGSDSTFSAITPSEQINCPVLLICGVDDQFLNVEFNARQIYDRMNKVGKGHLCNILRYPGAGHVIEPPYTPLCYSQFEPVGRAIVDNPHIIWGGESKAHAQAQEDSWSNILAFLRKHIAQAS